MFLTESSRQVGWRFAGLDFFGTPGSIDQISDPDQGNC
jgi:hypothetical protein